LAQVKPTFLSDSFVDCFKVLIMDFQLGTFDYTTSKATQVTRTTSS
jgi:hypothetical protein